MSWKPKAGEGPHAAAQGVQDLVFYGGLDVYDMSGILHESGHLIDARGNGQTDGNHQSSRQYYSSTANALTLIGYLETQEFKDAINADSCVPDPYAKTSMLFQLQSILNSFLIMMM